MRWFLLGSLLIIAASATPAMAATVVDEAHFLFDSPGAITVWYNATVSGDDAQATRNQIDSNPRDGTISAQERQTAENFVRLSLETPDGDEPESLDGVARTATLISSVTAINLTGPTASTSPFHVQIVGSKSFNETNSDAHVFRRDVGVQDKGNWQFTAPPGFKIGNVTGLQDPRRSQADRAFAGTSDGATPIEIHFTKITSSTTRVPVVEGTEGGIPSWVWFAIGGVLLAVVIAVVAFAAGRRRRPDAPAAAPVPQGAVRSPEARGMAPPVAPVRRLKCPRCSHIFIVAGGQRPYCPNCNYGR